MNIFYGRGGYKNFVNNIYRRWSFIEEFVSNSSMKYLSISGFKTGSFVIKP